MAPAVESWQAAKGGANPRLLGSDLSLRRQSIEPGLTRAALRSLRLQFSARQSRKCCLSAGTEQPAARCLGGGGGPAGTRPRHSLQGAEPFCWPSLN